MGIAEITVHVDPDVAQAYKAASEADRKKMDFLVSKRLTDYMHSTPSLDEVMNAMSGEAQQNALTPEILDSILND